MSNRETVRRHWLSVVARFRASGQSQAAFAGSAGVGLAALRYWLAKLRREQKAGRDLVPTTPVRFVPVAVATRPRAQLEIRVRGVRVSVPEGCDPVYVGRLVRALKAEASAC